MRLVLLITTLWLLFDVLLVAVLVTARHIYAAWWRMKVERLGRLARAGLP
jgi:hypothetical protein